MLTDYKKGTTSRTKVASCGKLSLMLVLSPTTAIHFLCKRSLQSAVTCLSPQLADIHTVLTHVYIYIYIDVETYKHTTDYGHMLTHEWTARCAHKQKTHTQPHPTHSCLFHIWYEVRWKGEEKEQAPINDERKQENEIKPESENQNKTKTITDCKQPPVDFSGCWVLYTSSLAGSPSADRSWSKECNSSLNIKRYTNN